VPSNALTELTTTVAWLACQVFNKSSQRCAHAAVREAFGYSLDNIIGDRRFGFDDDQVFTAGF
jgi:hypothetical protein